MAIDLVTKAEAYNHLRIDDDASDDWLAVMIPAVSSAIEEWVKDTSRLFETDGVTIRPIVKLAVLVELASQFANREGAGVDAVPSADGHGYTLCRAATAVLGPLRKSTVA